MTTTEHQLTELDPTRVTMLTRLLDLNARIADLTTEADALKQELRNLQPGEYAVNGQPAVRIARTRRFDPEKGLLLVPGPLHADCYSTVLDAAKVKKYLAPALLDTCMVEVGQPQVRVL